MLVQAVRKRAPAAGGLALDAFTSGLVGAYSTRRLLTAYAGSALEMRRESDNAIVDIGFTSDNLNETAVSAHVSGADLGRITKVYDQSGNTRHLLQATAARQLLCYDAANGYRATSNTHRGIGVAHLGADHGLLTDAFTAYTGTTISCYVVGQINIGPGTPVDGGRFAGVTNGTNPDWQTADGAILLCTRITTFAFQGTRNSIDLGDSSPLTTGETTVFAAGVRFDGTNWNIRVGSNTLSEASSGSFNVSRICMGIHDGTNGNMSYLQANYEYGIWFSDIGDSAMQTILANARTYWGAT